MNALLSLLIVSQCAGGACPTPTSFGWPTLYAQATPMSTPPVYAWRDTVYQGVRVRVWGRLEPDGSFTWYPESATNAPRIQAARQAATRPAVQPAAKPAPAPAPKAEPKAEPATPPVTGQGLPAWQTQGVDPSGLSKQEETRASGPAAQAFLTKYEDYKVGGLDDDKLKPSLTVIGTEAEREAVMKDFKPDGPLAEYAGRIHLQAYEPGNWAITQGHQQGGHPDIVLQLHDGKVVWRQQSYDGGAEVLREGLRRADPNYDAKRDPGPGKGSPSARASTAVAVGVIVLSLVILAYTLMGGEPPHVV